MAKPKLLMLRGLPGSGKTTWASRFCIENPNWNRVNKDLLRMVLFGEDFEWTRTIEQATIAEQDRLIVEWLSSGRSVVVDDTNLTPWHEERCKRIAASLGCEFEVKDFDTDIEVCIARDALRHGRAKVGERVIRTLAAKKERNDT